MAHGSMVLRALLAAVLLSSLVMASYVGFPSHINGINATIFWAFLYLFGLAFTPLYLILVVRLRPMIVIALISASLCAGHCTYRYFPAIQMKLSVLIFPIALLVAMIDSLAFTLRARARR